MHACDAKPSLLYWIVNKIADRVDATRVQIVSRRIHPWAIQNSGRVLYVMLNLNLFLGDFCERILVYFSSLN